MKHPVTPRLLKSALAAGALLGLSGCMYGGGGYYGDGYVNNAGYDCDPYAPFDDYYACDYGYGFANIGYGGGWYDRYYYPGYGIYVFDRGGKRHAMRDNHRRYWSRQRADYRGHHGRDRNWTPRQRAERQAGRYERRDDARDQRRGRYREDSSRRPDRADRRETRSSRGDRNDRASAGRDDQRSGGNRRPARAVQQPQVRPQPAARPAATPRPARAEGPRYSPRTSRSERARINDD